MARNRQELEHLLKRSFAEGATWPIDRPALRALSRRGLSDAQIAGFFSIDPHEVQAALDRH
jgi:hypothetical protein